MGFPVCGKQENVNETFNRTSHSKKEGQNAEKHVLSISVKASPAPSVPTLFHPIKPFHQPGFQPPQSKQLQGQQRSPDRLCLNPNSGSWPLHPKRVGQQLGQKQAAERAGLPPALLTFGGPEVPPGPAPPVHAARAALDCSLPQTRALSKSW